MHEPHDEPESARRTGRLRGDRGVAAVEFAFIVPLLALFIFGIITFGLILSFKQDVTRAAAEGGRAGAVAPRGQALDRAVEETERAVEGFDQQCNAGTGMACFINTHDCAVEVPSRTATGSVSGLGTDPDTCVTVELIYDYDNYPLLAKLPIVSGFLPNELRASSVSRLND
jgi:Flp pilus assembly protein TadG